MIAASDRVVVRQAVDAVWDAIERAGPFGAWQDTRPLDDPLAEDSQGWAARRRTFIANYAWAVPSREAIAAIAAFFEGRRLIEVCAGNGLWAMLLAKAGLDVLATDGEPPDTGRYFPVVAAEAEAAVQAHSEREALLLCWPPYRSDCAFRALQSFGGDRIAYVGDVRFTGDRRFHDLLAQDWLLAERIAIRAWPGLDDYGYFYRRK